MPSTCPASVGSFVEKKGRGLRPCIDYRGLNKINIKYPYSLPLIPAHACSQKNYAKLMYQQNWTNAAPIIWYASEKEKNGTMEQHSVHNHWALLIMPFGLKGATIVFQCFINYVLRECLGKYVITYMDDLLIYLTNMHRHSMHVKKVLELFCTNLH